jgi:hypothetical protein
MWYFGLLSLRSDYERKFSTQLQLTGDTMQKIILTGDICTLQKQSRIFLSKSNLNDSMHNITYICLLSTFTPKESLGVDVDSKQIYETSACDYSLYEIKFGLPLGIKGIRVISPRIPFTPRVILPLFPFAPIPFRPGSFHPHLLIVL